MARKNKVGWKNTERNVDRAMLGYKAIDVGQTDNRPSEDRGEALTAAKDTVVNICHFLGHHGFSRDDIKEILNSAFHTHYCVESGGGE